MGLVDVLIRRMLVRSLRTQVKLIARKGSVLKTSKALGVRQHKDAKLSPLSMKKAEAQVTRLLKKTRISEQQALSISF